MIAEAEKAARLATYDAVLAVNCPACTAKAGERCWNMVTGQPSNIVHAGRVERWKHPRRRWQ